MLRIAVCDDCADFIKQAAGMIDRWPDKPDNTLCHTFADGGELALAHSATPFDIILLDIVMPAVNGIETAREIRRYDKNVKIVFLTSSPEYAVESYTVKANNYLLKPVDESRLFACLDELCVQFLQQCRTITVKGLYAVQKIALNSIEYIEAQNKHIIFNLHDGSCIKTTEPLRTVETLLSLEDGFFKCHRSYIVNINCIDTYTAKEIKMRSGCLIPISRNCHKDFENAYFSVIFGKAGDADVI